MSTEAAKHIGKSIAWFGFWIAAASVLVACIMNGWRPWE
jgi:hypothetical protein